MPGGEDYQDSGAGCTQRVDLDDGSILLPIYFRPPGLNSRVAVARCEFDGEELRFVEHGNVLSDRRRHAGASRTVAGARWR